MFRADSGDLSDLSSKWDVNVPSPSASPSASSGSSIGSALSSSGSSSTNPGVEAAIPGSEDDEGHVLPTLFWGWGKKMIYTPVGKTVPSDDAQGKTVIGGVVGGQTIRSPEERSLQAAVEWFMALPFKNPEKYAQYRKLMDAAGLVTEEAGKESATEAWAQFALNIGTAYQMTGKKRTPEQWLTYLASGGDSWDPSSISGGDGSMDPGGFTGTRSQTSTSVTVPTARQIEGAAESAFVAALGREPTSGELARFRAMIKSEARNNPAVTTTSATYEDGELLNTSSTREGGYSGTDAAVDLENAVQSEEGYAEFQAASTYMDALMSAIGTPGGV